MGKMTERDLLVVDPADELALEGPFNRAVCKKLTFFNPSKEARISFKIKTTTPRVFSVRPNVGIVEPDQIVDIDIFVQPLVQDCPAQVRHKFLIQAAEVDKTITDVQEFWKSKDLTSLWETKIRVQLVEPGTELKHDAPLNYQTEANVEQPVQEEDGDPLAKLLKQVSNMEEERLELLQKVQELTKGKELSAKKPKNEGREKLCLIFTVVILMIALGAAIVVKN